MVKTPATRAMGQTLPELEAAIAEREAELAAQAERELA
jgi:hypothetical protein